MRHVPCVYLASVLCIMCQVSCHVSDVTCHDPVWLFLTVIRRRLCNMTGVLSFHTCDTNNDSVRKFVLPFVFPIFPSCLVTVLFGHHTSSKKRKERGTRLRQGEPTRYGGRQIREEKRREGGGGRGREEREERSEPIERDTNFNKKKQ